MGSFGGLACDAGAAGARAKLRRSGAGPWGRVVEWGRTCSPRLRHARARKTGRGGPEVGRGVSGAGWRFDEAWLSWTRFGASRVNSVAWTRAWFSGNSRRGFERGSGVQGPNRDVLDAFLMLRGHEPGALDAGMGSLGQLRAWGTTSMSCWEGLSSGMTPVLWARAGWRDTRPGSLGRAPDGGLVVQLRVVRARSWGVAD
jgi:hypothetical protein